MRAVHNKRYSLYCSGSAGNGQGYQVRLVASRLPKQETLTNAQKGACILAGEVPCLFHLQEHHIRQMRAGSDTEAGQLPVLLMNAFKINGINTHGSLIFWSNPLTKPNAIAEYSPFSHEQTGLCVGFIRN